MKGKPAEHKAHCLQFQQPTSKTKQLCICCSQQLLPEPPVLLAVTGFVKNKWLERPSVHTYKSTELVQLGASVNLFNKHEELKLFNYYYYF